MKTRITTILVMTLVLLTVIGAGWKWRSTAGWKWGPNPAEKALGTSSRPAHTGQDAVQPS
jgi:hypothetical protein